MWLQGKFLRLSGPERRLLAEATIWLGIARLSILTIPFRMLAPFLGRHMAESSNMTTPNNRFFVDRVSWAVQTASRHLPWKCNCLPQAIAGKSMLKCRGVHSTLYLGLAKDGDGNLQAHAWLRSGNILVTGKQGMNRFRVVSTFAEKKD